MGTIGRRLVKFGAAEALEHGELYSRREDRIDYNYSLRAINSMSSSALSVGSRDDWIETWRETANSKYVNNNQDYSIGKVQIRPIAWQKRRSSVRGTNRRRNTEETIDTS